MSQYTSPRRSADMEAEGTQVTLEMRDASESVLQIIETLDKPIKIIGIAGSSGSGKSTLAHELTPTPLGMDGFYLGGDAQTNFDHPDSLAMEEFGTHLLAIKNGAMTIQVPQYDFSTHRRMETNVTFTHNGLVVVEGIYGLFGKFRKLFDLTIFVEADPETCLERRIQRDIRERGRQREDVIAQWNTTVRPMYDEHISKQKNGADIVVVNNEVLRL